MLNVKKEQYTIRFLHFCLYYTMIQSITKKTKARFANTSILHVMCCQRSKCGRDVLMWLWSQSFCLLTFHWTKLLYKIMLYTLKHSNTPSCTQNSLLFAASAIETPWWWKIYGIYWRNGKEKRKEGRARRMQKEQRVGRGKMETERNGKREGNNLGFQRHSLFYCSIFLDFLVFLFIHPQ